MKTSKRVFLASVVSLVMLFPLLILGGCKPQSERLVEATPTPDSSSPIGASVSDIDRGGRIEEVTFDNQRSNGLSLDSGGDVDTEVVAVGDPSEQVFRTGNGRVLPSPDGNTDQDWYIQFQVDDGFLFGGEPTSALWIEVEYFDEGTDQFNIQYDAVSGGPFGDGRFKESEVVTKTGTGKFKTAIFRLTDAYFANRDNGADFRISDYSDGEEYIRRVTVTLKRATMIYLGGVILTMENGSVASAIAIEENRILDVGGDEDMLAYAGPRTTLIDLEGRTLMPGFVDAHSHVFNHWADRYESAQEYILSKGTTTYAEMGADENLMRDILAMEGRGKLRLRVSLYPLHVDACGNYLGAWFADDYPVSRQPGAMLQIPGVKLFNDGGSCNAPAVSYNSEGKLDGIGSGDLYFTVEELTEIISEAQDYGYQVAIHGCGDRAIQVNQDAIEAALGGGPNIYRHRIEHNTLLPDDLLPRYTEIDIVPLIFGAFPTCHFIGVTHQYGGSTPDEFRHWEWRWRDLIDENPDVHIAWHADYPPIGPGDPMRHLHGFVTRVETLADGTVCLPPDWAADDLLTVEEALPMMTIESAYALLREDEIGSLKSGKLADLIILSDNPLVVDHERIPDIQVLMTMVGGRVEHLAPGQDALSP